VRLRRVLEFVIILGSPVFITFTPWDLAAQQAAAPATGGADLKSLARQTLAKLDGEVSISGVREPIEIIRDKWGVAHIYAKNEEDLFFAQGYVVAQDRQMPDSLEERLIRLVAEHVEAQKSELVSYLRSLDCGYRKFKIFRNGGGPPLSCPESLQE
jgi:Penicillin amidase